MPKPESHAFRPWADIGRLLCEGIAALLVAVLCALLLAVSVGYVFHLYPTPQQFVAGSGLLMVLVFLGLESPDRYGRLAVAGIYAVVLVALLAFLAQAFGQSVRG